MNVALFELRKQFIAKTGLRAATGAMLSDPAVLGVIATKSREEQAQIVGIMLKMLKEQDRLLRTDTLTGISNRNAFMERLEEAIRKIGVEQGGKRHTHGVQVLMIDLGDFKKINDWYGHAAGDKALKVVARALAASVREEDTVARLGGDEFAAILPYTDDEGGEKVRRNLGQILNGLHFKWVHEGTEINIPIRANIGHCVVSPGMLAEQVMVTADVCMYEMKRLDKKSRMNVESPRAPIPAIG